MPLGTEDTEKSVIHSTRARHALHADAGAVGGGGLAADPDYYHRVTEALVGASDILIVGPANAKLELIKHIQTHDSYLADRVIGVETVEHLTDGHLGACACNYFLHMDPLL
jgi:hypothetical protein